MSDEKLDIEKIKSYWIVEADEALDVTDHLFEKKTTLTLSFLVILLWKKF